MHIYFSQPVWWRAPRVCVHSVVINTSFYDFFSGLFLPEYVFVSVSVWIVNVNVYVGSFRHRFILQFSSLLLSDFLVFLISCFQCSCYLKFIRFFVSECMITKNKRKSIIEKRISGIYVFSFNIFDAILIVVALSLLFDGLIFSCFVLFCSLFSPVFFSVLLMSISTWYR